MWVYKLESYTIKMNLNIKVMWDPEVEFEHANLVEQYKVQNAQH